MQLLSNVVRSPLVGLSKRVWQGHHEGTPHRVGGYSRWSLISSVSSRERTNYAQKVVYGDGIHHSQPCAVAGMSKAQSSVSEVCWQLPPPLPLLTDLVGSRQAPILSFHGKEYYMLMVFLGKPFPRTFILWLLGI